MLTACTNVMERKDCGRIVLRQFLERHDGRDPEEISSRASSFWKYLNTSLDHAIIDEQRKFGRQNEVWKRLEPLGGVSDDSPRVHREVAGRATWGDAFRQVVRSQKRRDIRRVIKLVEKRARARRASRKRDIILAWLRWLEGRETGDRRSMKELAEQLGVSSIYLRGAVHAFRKELKDEFGEDLRMLISSTTIGGGDIR